MSRTLPFPWYGGKYQHASFILDNLPHTERYIEVFGGSAVILINKEPSKIETYNDIDGEVVNFFEVCQKNREDLVERLGYTPHSREMFRKACEEEPEDDVERALYFLIRTAQSFNGIQGDTWASSIGTTRRGKPQRTQAWQTRVDQIEETADRFRDVQIESREATDVINRHDHEDALFYLDPPYPPSVRESTGQYKYEMDGSDNRELASVVRDIDGFAAISGYRCDLYEDLYDGWLVVSDQEKMLAGKGDISRQEVLYCNYDPDSVVN